MTSFGPVLLSLVLVFSLCNHFISICYPTHDTSDHFIGHIFFISFHWFKNFLFLMFLNVIWSICIC